MIKVLKETPVTAYGRDCLEQLVHDDEMNANVACDLCAYRGWSDYEECGADCCTVHGCTINPNAYFLISQINGTGESKK